MKHQASPRFWRSYEALPAAVQQQAYRAYELLKAGRYWSVRVGLRHRALALEVGEELLLWIWIGTHAQYDQLLQRQ